MIARLTREKELGRGGISSVNIHRLLFLHTSLSRWAG
jgi:hypothetical protein